MSIACSVVTYSLMVHICAVHTQLVLLVHVLLVHVMLCIDLQYASNSRYILVSPSQVCQVPQEQCGTLKTGILRDFLEYSDH